VSDGLLICRFKRLVWLGISYIFTLLNILYSGSFFFNKMCVFILFYSFEIHM